MAVFNEIERFFERNADLHVLFIFDPMQHLEMELTLNKPVYYRLLNLRIYDNDNRLNPIAKANVTNSTLIETDF